MKRTRDSNIFNDLTKQLEEILNKAKENDLCHLIEPIECTILKVKELKRARKVECEHSGECNSETGDLEMACSCDDWGPDVLGPDGKWMCELCGGKCFCDKIWDSRTDIPKKKIAKKAGTKANKEENIRGKNENLRKLFERDVSVECDSCICGSSIKNENERTINKNITSLSASNTKWIPCLCESSNKNENEVTADQKTFTSPKCNPCVCDQSKKIANKDQANNEKKSSSAARSKFNACICAVDHLTIEFRTLECISNDPECNKDSSRTKEMEKSLKTDISVLYDPRFCSSVKKDKHADDNDKISNLQDLTTDEPQTKLSLKQDQTGGSKTKAAYCAKRSKCKNCKCTYDEKGQKMKTEECRAASERKKKLMENLKKEKTARKFQDLQNSEVDDKLKGSVKTKISHSASNFSCHGKDGIIECKSSSMGLLRSLKQSKDQSCFKGMKAKNEERKPQQISKCASTRSDQKTCSEFPSEREQKEYEKPEKPLKCSEMARRETILSDCNNFPIIDEHRECKTESEEPIDNLKKGVCSLPIRRPISANVGSQCSPQRSEKVKKEYEITKKPVNCSEIPERVLTQKCDGISTQNPARGTLRRQRLLAEKNCAKSERKIVDPNFQSTVCNYCTPVTSEEELCPCGCGFFTEGVSATNPCSSNNSLNNPRQEEASTFKKPVSRSPKCDCEGSCELCC